MDQSLLWNNFKEISYVKHTLRAHFLTINNFEGDVPQVAYPAQSRPPPSQRGNWEYYIQLDPSPKHIAPHYFISSAWHVLMPFFAKFSIIRSPFSSQCFFFKFINVKYKKIGSSRQFPTLVCLPFFFYFDIVLFLDKEYKYLQCYD